MKFTTEQRRTFVALACKIAWADGIVTNQERSFVHSMMERFAHEEISDQELNSWLEIGVPPEELNILPADLGEVFFVEALHLAFADGELADEEAELLKQIMDRMFQDRPQGTALARIALDRRP